MIIAKYSHHPLQELHPYAWQTVDPMGKKVTVLGCNPHLDIY